MNNLKKNIRIKPSCCDSQKINEAIILASSLYKGDGIQRTVKFLPAQYHIKEPIIFDSGVVLLGSVGTEFVPVENPSTSLADSVSNSLVKAQSIANSSFDGTLSSTALLDEYQFQSSLVIPVGQWVMLESEYTHADIVPTGADIIRREIVKVIGKSGSGPYVYRINQKLSQTHGVGTGIRFITKLISNIGIENINFKMEGNTFAVGCLLDGVYHSKLNIAGAGASRALVHLNNGARNTRIKAYHRGQNNSVVQAISAHNGIVEFDYDHGSELGRCHPYGIPRGLGDIRWRSNDWAFRGQIGNGCTGLQLKGAIEFDIDITVRDTLLTERVSRDPDMVAMPGSGNVKGGAAGIEVNATPVPVSSTENAYRGRIRARLIDTRVPDSERRQCSFFSEDCETIMVERLEMICTQRYQNTSGENMFGANIYDSRTCIIDHLSVQGVEAGLILWGGWNRVHIGKYFWDHGIGQASICPIQIGHMHNSIYNFFSDISIGTMICDDRPSYFNLDMSTVSSPGIITKHSFRIGRLEFQNAHRGIDNIRFGWLVGENMPTPQNAEVYQLVKPIPFTVCTSSNIVSSSDHGYPNGLPITVRVANEQTGSLPSGLVADGEYFVRDRTKDTFKLTTTMDQNGALGSAITLVNSGSGSFEMAPTVFAFTKSTTSDPKDKITVLYGRNGWIPGGSGHLICFGPEREILLEEGAVGFIGDYVKAVSGSTKGLINNSSENSLGTIIHRKYPAPDHTVGILKT